MKISGKVTSYAGEGIPFASVYISDASGKPTGDGVVADFDGNFSLDNVKSSDFISFSSVGYVKTTLPMSGYVTQNNNILVKLKGDELPTVTITADRPVINLPYGTGSAQTYSLGPKIKTWPWVVAGGALVLGALAFGGYKLATK